MTSNQARAIELHALGIHHRDRGEWREALEAFESTRALEEQEPEHPRRWWNLGMTLHEIAWLKVKLGQLNEASQLYQLAREAKLRVPPGKREWNQFSSTVHELGYVQNQLGLKDLALKTFESALDANRMIDDAKLRRAADAATLYAVAHIHLDNEAWANALEALTAELASLDDAARSARELYWRAYAQVELEDWDAAEASALESHQLYEEIPNGLKDPDHHADVLFELAHLARHRGDRDGAAKRIRAARAIQRASRRGQHGRVR